MTQPQRVIFTAPGIAELQSYSPPQPASDEILIRTQVSLISPGTERAFFLGLPNTSGLYPKPTGYSNVGTIIEIGADVTGFAPGDRVANPGHHAAQVVVNHTRCVPIPAGVADEDAVFYHLLTIALQGVRRARVEVGEAVVVLGAGLIGLLAAQFARLSGAAPVIVVDPATTRHTFARQSGADSILASQDEALDAQIKAETGPAGPAVVIEATGRPEVILTAMQLAAPGGRVVLLGSTRGETEQVNFYREVHRRGISLIGAHNSARPALESRPGCWTQADDSRAVMQLLAHNRLAVGHLITHRFSWNQSLDAFALLKSWDTNALGILLNWTESS